jgi:hypothetical protein
MMYVLFALVGFVTFVGVDERAEANLEENDLPWFARLTTGRNCGNVDEVADFDARSL